MTMDQERINAMAQALLDMEMLERTTTEGGRYVAERLLAADDAWRAAHAPESEAVARLVEVLGENIDNYMTVYMCRKLNEKPGWLSRVRSAYDAVLAERAARTSDKRPPPPEPARTAAGDTLAEATRNYLRVSTQYAINRVAGVPPSERDDVESALAAYRSAAPATEADVAEAWRERPEAITAFDAWWRTKKPSPCKSVATAAFLAAWDIARALPGHSAEAPPKHSVCECIGGSSYATEDPAWRHCDVCGGLIATNPATGDYRSAEVPELATEVMVEAFSDAWSTGGFDWPDDGREVFRRLLNAALGAAPPQERGAEVERLVAAAYRLHDVCEGIANSEGGEYGPLIGPAAYALQAALSPFSAPPESPAADPWTREQVAALVQAARGLRLVPYGLCEADAQRFFGELRNVAAALAPFAALAEQDLAAAEPIHAPYGVSASGRPLELHELDDVPPQPASAPSATEGAGYTREQVEALVAAAWRALNRFGDYAAHHRANGAHDKAARNQAHVADLFDSLCPFAALAEQDGDNAPPVPAPQPGEAPAAGAPAPSAPAPDRLAELAEEIGKSLIDVEVIDGLLSAEPMATFFLAFAADRRGGAR